MALLKFNAKVLSCLNCIKTLLQLRGVNHESIGYYFFKLQYCFHLRLINEAGYDVKKFGL